MPKFETVAIIGVGLIGGSIGRALAVRSLAHRIIGVGRSETTLGEAQRLGAIHEYSTDLERGVREAEVVVVCTPVTQVADFAIRAAAAAPADVLITDAGSTKRTIVEAVEREERARRAFVGAHPIAGSERQGAAFSDPNLFDGRACVLTPTEMTPSDRVSKARTFWASIGCRVSEIDPISHDESLALTSHLPHAVAAALAASVPVEALELAAGAYRDGTRVAGADGGLWSAIFLENREPLLSAIDRFSEELGAFRQALLDRDGSAIRDWWEAARDRRSRFNPSPQPARPSVEH